MSRWIITGKEHGGGGQNLAIVANNNNYPAQSSCVRHEEAEKREPRGKASALYTAETQVQIIGPTTQHKVNTQLHMYKMVAWADGWNM